MPDLTDIDDLMAEALADTLAVARLEGAARRLVRLQEARAIGILTPAGRAAVAALAGAVEGLEAMGSTGCDEEVDNG